MIHIGKEFLFILHFRNEPNEPSMKSTGVTEMTSINMEMKEIGK